MSICVSGRSVAKFAIRDFEDLHLGKLRAVLSEAAKLARNHIVKDCVLCSSRGFICELCRLVDHLNFFCHLVQQFLA